VSGLATPVKTDSIKTNAPFKKEITASMKTNPVFADSMTSLESDRNPMQDFITRVDSTKQLFTDLDRRVAWLEERLSPGKEISKQTAKREGPQPSAPKAQVPPEASKPKPDPKPEADKPVPAKRKIDVSELPRDAYKVKLETRQRQGFVQQIAIVLEQLQMSGEAGCHRPILDVLGWINRGVAGSTVEFDELGQDPEEKLTHFVDVVEKSMRNLT
jgi:hypothetical protein